ncbi:MAG: AAA family ATPase [Thermoflexus sp.]|nr:AAA family ATPase [Thermoflexus sp.]
MIREVEIEGFKSIRKLRLECRRINLFIGPHNTGKSNLLESLGMFSLPYAPEELRAFVRCQTMADLFYDQDLESAVRVRAGVYRWTLEYNPSAPRLFRITADTHGHFDSSFTYEYDSNVKFVKGVSPDPGYFPFRFYRFNPLERFPKTEPAFLRPPHGENMIHLLLLHKPLRQEIADIFAEYDLRLILKPQEDRIELQKEADGVVIAYPYILASDTLRSLVFHLLAIETNEGALLIFEEPEAHAFPYYTKYLAERIAFDARNQYWISTHNPYFLLAILEKAPQEDVAVFLTAWRERATQVRPLGEAEIQEMVDAGCSLFFDLERFLSSEEAE